MVRRLFLWCVYFPCGSVVESVFGGAYWIIDWVFGEVLVSASELCGALRFCVFVRASVTHSFVGIFCYVAVYGAEALYAAFGGLHIDFVTSSVGGIASCCCVTLVMSVIHFMTRLMVCSLELFSEF